jgi:hypothetical protein
MVYNSESTNRATSNNGAADAITFNLGKKKIFDVLMLRNVIEFGNRTTDRYSGLLFNFVCLETIAQHCRITRCDRIILAGQL